MQRECEGPRDGRHLGGGKLTAGDFDVDDRTDLATTLPAVQKVAIYTDRRDFGSIYGTSVPRSLTSYRRMPLDTFWLTLGLPNRSMSTTLHNITHTSSQGQLLPELL